MSDKTRILIAIESPEYNIMEKLGVDSLAEPNKIAIKEKLIES